MTKKFLTFSMLAAACLIASATLSARAGEVVLHDDQLLAAFDTDSGALTRLEDKTTHWIIERRPELGVPFRILAPLPGRRYNFAWGRQQHASDVSKTSDQQVHIQWRNLPTEHGGVLPLVFTATIGLTNGQLTFAAVLEDNSDVPVETVEYPYLGDLNPPSRAGYFSANYVKDGKGAGHQADQLYPHFNNEKGYWGDFFPTKMLETTPRDLYCLLQGEDEGLCVALKTPTLPYRLMYYFEQKPGLVSSVNQLVPPEDEIGGTTVNLEFRPCHFVFTGAHSKVTLVPVVLSCYHGDWHEGARVFKKMHASLAAQ